VLLRYVVLLFAAFSLSTAGRTASAGVQPSSGPIYGGTNITITGSNFDANSSVYVDGNPATNVVVVNSTTITAVTPEGFTNGPVDVDVQTTIDYFSFPGAFTYVAPTITSVNPPQGTIIGGTNVTISGTLFTNGMQLSFDGNPASNVMVIDSNTMTATTPVGYTDGPVGVDIDFQTNTTSLANGFTYLQPIISAITPSSGISAGGTPITISGNYFTNDVSIDFDGSNATNVSFIDSTKITAVTPSTGMIGPATVTLNVGGGVGSATTTFTYTENPPPTLNSMAPKNGNSNGGAAVTITGTGFQNNSVAYLGSLSTLITNLVVVDNTMITGDTPALPAGTYNLTVTNQDGQSSTLANAFTVTQAPLAGDLAPKGDPDGQLNAADLLILQRIVLGLDTSNSYEQLFGDVAPLNNPDGQLNTGDLVVLERAVLGEITLPRINDTSPPQISIIVPSDGATLTQTRVAVIGVLDEPANVSVNGNNMGLLTSFNAPVTLQQGANAITVVAMDSSANIATATINVTVDSRAPIPVNVGKLTVKALGGGMTSFVGSAGAAEPGSTVQFTNTNTGAKVTVIADTSGAFSKQFSTNNGDVIQIGLVDVAGNVSESMAYTVGAKVQIVTPIKNTAVDGSDIPVSGVFSGGAGSGITVNTEQACIFGNAFFRNQLPLQVGSNTVTATLTDTAGVTDQYSVPVVSNGNVVLTLNADNDCGVAPLTTNFSIGTAGVNAQQIEVDFDGDGVPDFSTTDNTATISNTYTAPGVYPATAWVLDDQGIEHEAHLNVVAQDEAVQNDIFQQIWSNFSAALSAGDATTALQSIRVQSRGFYNPILLVLAPNLPEIVGDFSGIQKIQIGENVAEYAVLTVVNSKVKTFVVTFTKDSDGIWRISSM